MKFSIFALLAVLVVAFGQETAVRHLEGFKVFAAIATTEEQAEALRTLYSSDEYDFWTSPNSLGATDIMVSPEQEKGLIKIFEAHGMSYTVKFEDVEKLVEEERIANAKAYTGRMDWQSYASYADIAEFMNGINSTFAKVSVIGQSYEGRDIFAVKISIGRIPKKSMLIECNIAARDWLAGATGTWIINELLTKSDAYEDILKQVDIYVVPMVNPDGYEFSRTSERTWRKTRSLNPGSSCVGTNLNVNFDFYWGSSPQQCSDSYRGPNPFSESESRTLRDFVMTQEAAGARFVAYMALHHSFSQAWLLPYASAAFYPVDYADQLKLGQAAIVAIQGVHGTLYTTVAGSQYHYARGGQSDDWAKNHGIKYTAAIQMRQPAIFLPPEQIIPNAEEVWAGLQVVIQTIIKTP